MFGSMKALLEAIDERAEHHAQQQAAEVEAGMGEEPMGSLKEATGAAVVAVDEGHMSVRGGSAIIHTEDEHSSRAVERPLSFPSFPTQPVAPSSHPFAEQPNSGAGLMDAKRSDALPLWDHVENVTSSGSAAPSLGYKVDLLQLRQKGEEFDALARDARRYKAEAEAAKQELLQRSLQIHQLEDALRDVKERFDEHKAKSRFLLEEKQRDYEVLLRRLEAADTENGCRSVDGSKKADGSAEDTAAELRERVENLEGVVVSVEQERELLRAQVARCRHELAEAHEQRSAFLQQVDFLRLDLRGAQEALESEVAAHHQSRVLLQGRQRELNELRAAVEKNGGTFTAGGSLIALRGNDGNTRDQALISRQLLERQNALEAALRDAAEWRRRFERATQRLEEHTTTRVVVAPSSHPARDVTEIRSALLRRFSRINRVTSVAIELITQVDAAAVRFGRLLRRKPVLRVTVVLYVVCLHGWIMMLVLMGSRVLNRSSFAAATHAEP